MNKRNIGRPESGHAPVNRRHKDSLFHLLFGTEEYKANALALYNAINQTNYKVEELEITTLEDAIYMGVKNDASLIVGNEMSLWEHQSSLNPNMPLRGLLYFAPLYEAYVRKNGLNLYGRRRLRIPVPRYFVFYNGSEEQAEQRVLRLSDLYEGAGDIEITATMLNVNWGKNRALMERCRPLRDYARFLGMIREKRREMSLEEAVKQAMEQCIQEGIMADFLQKHKVHISSLLTEYDEETTMELLKRDYIEEGIEIGMKKGLERGRAEGKAEGLKQAVRKLMSTQNISREEAEKILLS